MQHLNIEEIARLADEMPTPEEARHLEACEHCAEALEEMREQTAQLAAMPDLDPPDGAWERIEAELRTKHLVTRRAVRIGGSMAALRIAASLAIFAIGAATGGIYVATFGTTAPTASATTNLPVSSVLDLPPTTDVNEAARRLNDAETAYLRALSAYSELTESGEGLDPINRLAALEAIVLTTRAALQEAPADPVINNYHLAALGQRDALLKQMEGIPDKTWY